MNRYRTIKAIPPRWFISWHKYLQEIIIPQTKLLRERIRGCVQASWLQITGLVLIGIAYLLFGTNHPYIAWFGVLIPVGIIELLLMGIWYTTIARFAQYLFGKTTDWIIMVWLVGLAWRWCGPNPAGLYLIGLLLNHFRKRQP